MKKIIRWLNYVSTPHVKEISGQYMQLVSIPNNVWNPVFIAGTITFVLSMLFRGFLDATFAVLPLALSTLVLFAGVWILSANGTVVFDNHASNCYCIYKHLGYLQKIYVYPITSIDKIVVENEGSHTFKISLQKDDGMAVKIAASKDKIVMMDLGKRISAFLQIPLES